MVFACLQLTVEQAPHALRLLLVARRVRGQAFLHPPARGLAPMSTAYSYSISDRQRCSLRPRRRKWVMHVQQATLELSCAHAKVLQLTNMMTSVSTCRRPTA
jgi:hypothetical protein